MTSKIQRTRTLIQFSGCSLILHFSVLKKVTVNIQKHREILRAEYFHIIARNALREQPVKAIKTLHGYMVFDNIK